MSNKFDLLMYIYNFWSENGDEYLKELPLAGSPFYLIFSLISIFLVIKLIEFLRRNSNPYDIRPLLLIYDGFFFGVFGVAFVIFFVASNFGSFLFSCSTPGYVFPIGLNNELVIKHLVYTYIIFSIVSLGNQIIIPFGRSKTKQVRRGNVSLTNYLETYVFNDSFITLIHQCIWTIILAHYLIVNPVGETLFEPLLDCFNHLFYYGSGILLVTEPITTTSLGNKSGKKKVANSNSVATLKVKLREVARCLCFFAISVHTFYIQSKQGHCHPPSSSRKAISYNMTSVMVVSLYSAVFSAINLIRLFGSFQPSLEGKRQSNDKPMANGNLGNKYRRVTRLTKIPVALAQ